ncbi:histone deacetylase 6 isoform X2 [Octopus bimaculoides]|uniref:histone deacetylase 6 isoform X2 n=2 Tax=Octopus bimaculoides TaxID=37653 RepID=UPI0022DF2088|nr:histone deacetylase 6 isoform X2 [Octopus bimaculoides]
MHVQRGSVTLIKMSEAGASGGKSPDNRDKYLMNLMSKESMYCVQPLTWCPHLEKVTSVPPQGLDTSSPCETCGDTNENWVCLTCYKVFCSRYVQEHMVKHHEVEPDHYIVLSYADLSVWCYGCNSYVEHELIQNAKKTACKHKFGE